MHEHARLLSALWITTLLAGCTELASPSPNDQAQGDAGNTKHEFASGSDAGKAPANGGRDAGSKPESKPDGSSGAGGSSGAAMDGSTGGSSGDSGDAGADASDACEVLTFYADTDGDGYGDPAVTKSACDAPAGYVSDHGDCDDACKSCHPGGDETCDEHDNNCDDTVDEGCACEPGTTRPCGEERGECEPGTQACDEGLWSSDCVGAVGPAASELCNGLDDDCNGMTDDAIAKLGDACSAGVGACKHNGTYVCATNPHDPPVCTATAGSAVTEICANSTDDDCDTKTDEAPSATSCCIDAHCGLNQRCDTGSCVDKTGCELRSRPSGVTAADYQCLDFDKTSSFTPWTAVTASSGGIAISADQASSGTKSVYATLGGVANSEGRLRWNAVGAKSITSVSLSADVHFPPVIGFHEYWTGHDEVLCIHHNTSSFCVNYSYSEDNPGGWGLSLEEMQTTGTLETHVCLLLPPPTENEWSRIELRVSSSGKPVVLLKGTALSSPDCVFSLLTSTSVTMEVGMKQTAADEAWQLYFDDVEAAIKR